MARISLLFSLAFVLAIGSVSAHPPSHKKTQKSLCPPTLSELQTFPYIETSKLIEKKVASAPDTIQFKTLFAICKSYNDFLGGFKVAFAKDVSASLQTKYTLMTKAMLAAQASVGVEGQLEAKLRKRYTAMAEGYVTIVKKVAEISAKYKFDSEAKLSKSDMIEIDRCLIKLKGSISVFIKVITQCSKKFSVEKKIGYQHGPGGFVGALVNHGVGFGGKLIGLGGHGQVGAGAQGEAKIGTHVEVKAGAQGEAKIGTHVEVKSGAQGEAKIGTHVELKAGAHAGGKIGGHAGVKVGGHAGAKAGGNIGGLFNGFLGFGGKSHFDAAGKAKVDGGSGFRSVNHENKKHLD